MLSRRTSAIHGIPTGNGHLQVASAIRSFTSALGPSQRQLALRMKVPRTYVSKIENEKATPTLSSLERLANSTGSQLARTDQRRLFAGT